MPTSKRHFAGRQQQFLTSSTCHRAELMESDQFRWSFVEALAGCGKTRRRCHSEESNILIGGRLDKLNYTHGNPVKCGLVASPEQWPWSSSPVDRKVALCARLRRVSARILIPVQG
jgi:hypothetical protein